MKAYKAWDNNDCAGSATVIFAESAQKAKIEAMSTAACVDAEYIDIRVHRLPEMDSRYNGNKEVDWYNIEDRRALVALGWTCLDISEECDICICKSQCGYWEDLGVRNG